MHQLSIKQITRLSLSLLAGFAFIPFLLPQATKAQILEQDPSQDFQRQQNPGDSFGGSSGGEVFSPFNLIHRANFGNLRNDEELSIEQRNNIDEAAAEFRAKQKERLGNPVPVPANSNNPGNSGNAPSQSN